jgi:hypothetical protein
MADENNTNRSTLIALVVAGLFFGSIALYYGLRPGQVTVTALFSVSSDSSPILDEEQPFDPREFQIVQRTQQALLKSYFVAQAALRGPGIETLAVLAPHDDKVQWLIDNVDVKFMDNSEILSVSLTGPADDAEDLRQLVDALSEAYLKEVVFDQRQRQLVVRDAMQQSLAGLDDEIRQKLEVLHDLTKDLGAGAKESVELAVGQREVDILQQIQTKLATRIRHLEFQDHAPARIRRVQKATIEKD